MKTLDYRDDSVEVRMRAWIGKCAAENATGHSPLLTVMTKRRPPSSCGTRFNAYLPDVFFGRVRLAEAEKCLRAGIVAFDLMFDSVAGHLALRNWTTEDTERVHAIVCTLPPVSCDFSLDTVSAFVEDPDGARYRHETLGDNAYMCANRRHVYMAALVHEELKDAIRRADHEAAARLATAAAAHAERMEQGL